MTTKPRSVKAGFSVLARLVLSLLCAGLGVCLAGVILLWQPPLSLLRQAALPAVRRALSPHQLHLAGLEIQLGLQGHLKLRDLKLFAPKGFRQPMLAIDELRVRYAITSLTPPKVIIKEAAVVRPTVVVEQQGSRLNWALSSGSGETQVEPSVDDGARPEEAAPAFGIELRKLAVEDLRVVLLMPQQKAEMGQINLLASGGYTAGQAQGRVRLHLGTSDQGTKASFESRLPSIGAVFRQEFVLDARLDSLSPLVADASLTLESAFQQFRGFGKIGLPKVGAQVDAHVNLAKGEAAVDQLRIAFDDSELLRGKVALSNIAKEGALASDLAEVAVADVDIAHISVDLAQWLRFGGAWTEGIDCGGSISLKPIRVSGKLGDLRRGKLASASTVLRLNELAVRSLEAKQPLVADIVKSFRALRVSGVEGTVALSAAGEQKTTLETLLSGLAVASKEPARGLSVSTDLKVGRASFAPIALRDLRLQLNGRAARPSQDLGQAGLALDLALGSVRLRQRKLGIVRAPLHLSIRSAADLAQRRVLLPQLRLRLADWLRFDLTAMTPDWQQRVVAVKASLARLQLPKMLAWLPKKLRKQIPLQQVQGSIGLDLSVDGRFPRDIRPLVRDPLRAPLRTDLDLSLRNIGFRVPGKTRVAIAGAQARLQLRARRAAWKANLAARLASLDIPGTVNAKGFSSQTKLMLRPKGGNLDNRAEVERVRLIASHVGARKIAVSAKASAGLDLTKLLRGQSSRIHRLRSSASLSAAALALGQGEEAIRLKKYRANVALQHSQRKKMPFHLAVRHELDRMKMPRQRVDIRGTRLSTTVDAAGYRLALPLSEIPSLEALAARVVVDGGMTKIIQPDLERPAVGTRFGLKARLVPHQALAVDSLKLLVPRFALRAELDGRVAHPVALLADLQHGGIGELPEMTIGGSVAVDTPSRKRKRKAHHLIGGLRQSGKAGLTFRVDRVSGQELNLSTRLVANRFYLWNDSDGFVMSKTGMDQPRHVEFALRNFSADVPMHQRATLSFSPFRVRLPPRAKSRVAKLTTGAAYRLVRPFTSRRANFSIDGVSLTDQLIDGKSGNVLSTKRLELGQTVLDLAYEDGVLQLNQLYLRALGGDIFGDLEVSLPELDPMRGRLGDIWLRTQLQLTNVDFARLAGSSGAPVKVNGSARGEYRFADRYVKGRVALNDISLKTLDKVLVAMDPHKVNPSIQGARDTVRAWYFRAIDPAVERVTAWIDHSLVNVDIRLGAIWPLGALLRQAISRTKIRRVSIKPVLPGKKRKKHKTTRAQRSARRHPGDWRVR